MLPDVTMESLIAHAERFGADGVAEAAEEAGFGHGEVILLRARLSRLPMLSGYRDGRKFPLPESVGRKITTDEVSTAAADLLGRGWTAVKIAAELGISRTAVEGSEPKRGATQKRGFDRVTKRLKSHTYQPFSEGRRIP